MKLARISIILIGLALPATSVLSAADGLTIQNGWFVHNGKALWGCAQHNGWWGGYRKGAGWINQYKVRTAICRNDPGRIGPSFTEDLDKLTDAMLRFGYPGFEHNYGLWYDRRRDNHDTARRTDANAEPPFLEQPWARSSDGAAAWDGLPRYDLEKFNTWYFARLREFASHCDTKGTILFHNFYMQHALLETPAHYVDFPWRPVNCIQDTQMPDGIPAANAFYDVTNPARRELHRIYICKCLDELGGYTNVIHILSEEYTGPLSFMQFWIDTVKQWQSERGKEVKICLAATKDVTDAILNDPARAPAISTICLSYWWCNADGSLYAPEGGRQIAGRYTGNLPKNTTPQSLYRQIREYRTRYPDKAMIQHHSVELEKAWAFLMAGGSMIIARMQYADSLPPKNPWNPPDDYIAPPESEIILPTYRFMNTHLSRALPNMRPKDIVLSNKDKTWCLTDETQNYLIFALEGGRIDLDLSRAPKTSFETNWLNPKTGKLTPATNAEAIGGTKPSFNAPNKEPWALWLTATRRN